MGSSKTKASVTLIRALSPGFKSRMPLYGRASLE